MHNKEYFCIPPNIFADSKRGHFFLLPCFIPKMATSTSSSIIKLTLPLLLPFFFLILLHSSLSALVTHRHKWNPSESHIFSPPHHEKHGLRRNPTAKDIEIAEEQRKPLMESERESFSEVIEVEANKESAPPPENKCAAKGSDGSGESTKKKEIKIFATTFNVNGQYPGKHPAVKLPLKDDGKDSDKNAGHPGKHPDEHPAQDPEPALMSEWIKINEQDPPDIVAIGLQEVTEIANPGHYAFDFVVGKIEEKWENALKTHLGKYGRYQRAERARLSGIYLIIFVRDAIKEQEPKEDIGVMFTRKDPKEGNAFKLSHFRMSELKRGRFWKFPMWWPNKGAVAISFRLNDCATICFVNSHMEAGHKEKKLKKRNEDQRAISEINFSSNHKNGEQSRDLPLTVLDHDLVIWVGDLNYRLVNEPTDDEKIKVMEDSKDGKGYEDYIEQDQLNIHRKKGDIFVEFKEKRIEFKQTYKYQPDTIDDWNKTKKEMPAWCDRILFRVKNDKDEEIEEGEPTGKNDHIRVKQTGYESSKTPIFSDHKPVFGLFNVWVSPMNMDMEKVENGNGNELAHHNAGTK